VLALAHARPWRPAPGWAPWQAPGLAPAQALPYALLAAVRAHTNPAALRGYFEAGAKEAVPAQPQLA
jgi:hypothetical protein